MENLSDIDVHKAGVGSLVSRKRRGSITVRAKHYRKLAPLALVFALMALAFPAHADWQYTHWGMTPQQVIAAAPSSANLKLPKPDRHGRDTIMLGEYATGRFYFAALFHFGRFGLDSVELLPMKPTNSDDVLRALQEKYGMWSPGLIWFDRADNFSVDFDRIAGVTYKPLHGTEKRGL